MAAGEISALVAQVRVLTRANEVLGSEVEEGKRTLTLTLTLTAVLWTEVEEGKRVRGANDSSSSEL